MVVSNAGISHGAFNASGLLDVESGTNLKHTISDKYKKWNFFLPCVFEWMPWIDLSGAFVTSTHSDLDKFPLLFGGYTVDVLKFEMSDVGSGSTNGASFLLNFLPLVDS